jgi:2-(1,2-epoxy-1,2-dihydrophenyl)acetyl-CoA isomerase
MLSAYPVVPGVEVQLADGVLSLRLSNPSRRNALTDETMRALIDSLELAQRDEDVRAVLLSGDGGHFCSGFDIVQRNARNDGPRPRPGAIQRRLPAQAHRLIPQLTALQAPVVCVVSGYAVGIGMQLALASDFVVADRTAMFWEPFMSRGMTPDSGATWLTVRTVGLARARRLLILGERLDAETARDWGIVHEVVDDALAAGRALAHRLASGPTVALGLTKALINSAAESTLADTLAAEAFALELSSRSEDFREGLRAFVEKREPRFTGR